MMSLSENYRAGNLLKSQGLLQSTSTTSNTLVFTIQCKYETAKSGDRWLSEDNASTSLYLRQRFFLHFTWNCFAAMSPERPQRHYSWRLHIVKLEQYTRAYLRKLWVHHVLISAEAQMLLERCHRQIADPNRYHRARSRYHLLRS